MKFFEGILLRIFAILLLAILVACSVKDQPTLAQQVDATMHKCSDLGIDTLFWFTEFYADKAPDTTMLWRRNLDSISYPTGAGKSWKFEWCCNGVVDTTRQILTSLDSAKVRANVREDSLHLVCNVLSDTIRIDPINRPFPIGILRTVIQSILDTTKKNELALPLPAGIHFTVHANDSNVAIGTLYGGRQTNDSLRLHSSQDSSGSMENEAPKYFHDTPETLIVLLPQQAGHWNLLYNDAYGFVDSVQF